MGLTFRNVLVASVVGAIAFGVACSPRDEQPITCPENELGDATPISGPPEDLKPASAEELKTLTEGNNQFAIDLYKKLAETEGNIIISPYSISSALAMAYGGARGQTAREMAKTMHFTLPANRLHPAFAATTRKLQENRSDEQRLDIANALWGQQGLALSPAFLSLIQTHHAGALQELDFRSDPEQARRTINRWTAEKTQTKIPELIRSGQVDSHTQLVLTNAVFFKGRWVWPFPKTATHPDKFQVSENKSVPVQMMNVTALFGYVETKTAQVASVYYKGGDRVLMLVLPRQADGFGAVEQELTAVQVQKWLHDEGSAKLNLSLPMLQIQTRAELSHSLTAMGMRSMFSSGADFSGISKRPIVGSKIVHATTLDTDEEGTEASGATAVVTTEPESRPVPEKPIAYRLDRPFLLLLLDQPTGVILFAGRVLNPHLTQR